MKLGERNASSAIVIILKFTRFVVTRCRVALKTTCDRRWHLPADQFLPWPVISPDASPIEHIWDVIGCFLLD
ncbi:hypothetical protein TNCV_4891271 [Trichonephila clavipes]|nr:hypothetical protein TNCV_4891271 [Trichonephila clavipes]